jgi:cation:H+ antiporter
MMIAYYLVLIFGFSLLLIKSTDILVINLRSLARRTRLGKFAITAIVLALATSLPEFFVGVTAAYEGLPNLALGNVIGSNIADLSLVVGGAALIGGSLRVKGGFSKGDLVYAFLAGLAPIVLLFDRSLTRLDGLILLLLYGFYNIWVLSERRRHLAKREVKEGVIHQILRRLRYKEAGRELAWIFLGVALLLFSADMLVRMGKMVALSLNIPVLLVGLFLVSIGTSLPELAFELKSLREGETKMFFGDLLGSIVANGTLVIGVTALIRPIVIRAFEEYLLATITYVVIFLIFYFFIRTKQRLERWEGAFLIGFYLAFLLAEFVHP